MTLDGVEHAVGLSRGLGIEVRTERPKTANPIGIYESAEAHARLRIQSLIQVHVDGCILARTIFRNRPGQARASTTGCDPFRRGKSARRPTQGPLLQTGSARSSLTARPERNLFLLPLLGQQLLRDRL